MKTATQRMFVEYRDKLRQLHGLPKYLDAHKVLAQDLKLLAGRIKTESGLKQKEINRALYVIGKIVGNPRKLKTKAH